VQAMGRQGTGGRNGGGCPVIDEKESLRYGHYDLLVGYKVSSSLGTPLLAQLSQLCSGNLTVIVLCELICFFALLVVYVYCLCCFGTPRPPRRCSRPSVLSSRSVTMTLTIVVPAQPQWTTLVCHRLLLKGGRRRGCTGSACGGFPARDAPEQYEQVTW